MCYGQLRKHCDLIGPYSRINIIRVVAIPSKELLLLMISAISLLRVSSKGLCFIHLSVVAICLNS
ncbi:hypothetical protein LINPERHAP1_LOCUS17237, partial [Linum perenne]